MRDTVKYAADKRLTYELAGRLGIPLPRTWYPRSADELDAIDSPRWPMLIKPAIKEHFIYRTRVKGWIVRDRDELRKRFVDATTIVPAAEVMVQDMIPGNGRTQYSYCTFFKGGRSLARMTVQRQRQQPSDLGHLCEIPTLRLPTDDDHAGFHVMAAHESRETTNGDPVHHRLSPSHGAPDHPTRRASPNTAAVACDTAPPSARGIPGVVARLVPSPRAGTSGSRARYARGQRRIP